MSGFFCEMGWGGHFFLLKFNPRMRHSGVGRNPDVV
jgi:hypothetical protein